MDATTDQDQIMTWWTQQPDFNVALATGPASGVFAVDVDSPEAEHELARLEAERGTSPAPSRPSPAGVGICSLSGQIKLRSATPRAKLHQGLIPGVRVGSF